MKENMITEHESLPDYYNDDNDDEALLMTVMTKNTWASEQSCPTQIPPEKRFLPENDQVTIVNGDDISTTLMVVIFEDDVNLAPRLLSMTMKMKVARM